ncbi:integrase core domain-containing protein, partial [Xanthomonas dyei]|uniref:integrase core domain-containing protein n=1 Tax=Xanthomonas dyei TaxID=743699 RepID=UPI001FD4071B
PEIAGPKQIPRRRRRSNSLLSNGKVIGGGSAYVESFNGRLRDECLNEHWFPTLLHARTEIERWRREYNEDRPKKAIGGMTPSAYAQHLANTDIINPGL